MMLRAIYHLPKIKKVLMVVCCGREVSFVFFHENIFLKAILGSRELIQRSPPALFDNSESMELLAVNLLTPFSSQGPSSELIKVLSKVSDEDVIDIFFNS
jgi:hypothetical protein